MTPQPILQNLVEMTGLRDHQRLEISVLSTLHKLHDIVRVRALELFPHHGQMCVRPRTWQEAADQHWVSTNRDPSTDPAQQPLSAYPTLAHCVATQQSQAIESPDTDGTHTLWLLVWAQNQVSTCIEICQTQPFSTAELDVITGIFTVYQNYQSLLDYSERDALTGLHNRKTFDDQFARYADTAIGLSRHSDENGAMRQWLAVIDIDHFKQVNDRFGHLYGDEVLILVANLLRNSFRSHDRIFRFGGEEFVVLLRSATLEEARSAFNRFRLAVQEHSFPQVGQITVSVGFVGTSQQQAPVEILGQADQALYHAKEHGRNQVCFYDDLIASGDLLAKIAHDDIELF